MGNSPLTPAQADGRRGPALTDVSAADPQHYEAYGVHPAWGTEPVAGRLVVAPWALRFESAHGTVQLPYQDLRLGFHPDDGRVFLSHPGVADWTIYTPESALLAHPAFQGRAALRQQIDRLTGRRWAWLKLLWVTVGFVAVFLVVWWGVWMGSGWLVERAAARVPLAWEQQFGNRLFDQVRSNMVLATDPRFIELIAAVTNRLLPAVPTRGLVFQFHVVQAVEPTAWALPGGHVLVHTGLIQLADTPDQLAGVLAHEMAHVTQRHAMRRLLGSLGPWLLMRCATGDDHRLLAVLADSSAVILHQAYSRNHEYEADDRAWDYLRAAGLNPRGLIELLQKLEAAEARQRQLLAKLGADAQPPPGLRSHPLTQDRIQRLEARWQQQVRQGQSRPGQPRGP